MSDQAGVTLFRAHTLDEHGARVRFAIRATPQGLVVVTVAPDGAQYGLVLDRDHAQQVRHAITGWLVDASPPSAVA